MSSATLTPAARTTGRLYLIRAIIALVWSGLLFGALAQSGAELSVFAVVLLVVYPVIDVVASVVDARTQQESARIQWINAAISTVTAVAVLIAALDGPARVLWVYGAWAVLTGLIQLGLGVVRLRRGLPGQWPMIISGGGSVLVGLTFFKPGTALTGVAGYAIGGAILYLISTVRQHRAGRA